MAIEYASKYAAKVDERFVVASLTNAAVNNDFEFTGVDTVKVYSVPTVALNDYSLTGTNRYGTPEDLQNEVQSLVLTQDKAFTFIIDSKSEDDTMGAMEAGKALRREIDEVITSHSCFFRVENAADIKELATEDFLQAAIRNLYSIGNANRSESVMLSGGLILNKMISIFIEVIFVVTTIY